MNPFVNMTGYNSFRENLRINDKEFVRRFLYIPLTMHRKEGKNSGHNQGEYTSRTR